MLKWLKSIDWIPILASVLLTTWVLWALSSIEKPPGKPQTTNGQNHERSENREGDHAGFFSSLGVWIEDNHLAVEAGSTFAVACFTFFLFLSTAGLWIVTRRMGNRQSEEVRILQRAYVSVEPGGIKPYVSGSEKLSCDILIRNAGNLPAHDIAWYIRWKFSVDPEDTDFCISEKFDGRITLAPKTIMRKGSPFIPRADFLNFRDAGTDRKCWFYVWGHVKYLDGFSKERFTDFCHRYNLLGEKELTIPPENGRFHEHGNRTDEQ